MVNEELSVVLPERTHRGEGINLATILIDCSHFLGDLNSEIYPLSQIKRASIVHAT